ncbi:hypothetical protein QW131_30750 [Roseibium salinum]|nr:hypothetical protein [Roseibium salinum]
MRAITPSATGPSETGTRSYIDVPRLGWYIALPCLAILLTVFHRLATGVWWLADPVRMADFVAGAPFQYRVLLPAIVAGITDVAPLAGRECRVHIPRSRDLDSPDRCRPSRAGGTRHRRLGFRAPASSHHHRCAGGAPRDRAGPALSIDLSR